MSVINKKQIFSIVLILSLPFFFQNCGEEGFISSNGLVEFSSFEEVYPSMDEKGDLSVKYKQKDRSYLRSEGYLRDTDRIYKAVGSMPTSVSAILTGDTSTGTPAGGDIPILDEPGYAGSVTNYYSGEFHFMRSQATSFKNNQRYLYPDRYYGEPNYQSIFEEQGMGIISTNVNLKSDGSVLKTPAVFYQYRADYFREKAVIFVLEDKLFDASDDVGARSLTLNRQHFVKLAKKGYLVVHLKPKGLSKYLSLETNRCGNIEKSFFLGAKQIRYAVKAVVEKADYFGVNKNKMFIVGFGEGGTLAAYTAFLDQNEATTKFEGGLPVVPGFEGKSLFKAVGISGGGVMDSSILNGASKARVVTIHGGCDETVKVDGSEIYGCTNNVAAVNPISSKQLTDFATGYLGSSASVLHCGKGSDTSQVRSLDTQFGYFATYFHNVLGGTNGSVFSNHYRNTHCRNNREDGDDNWTCSYPAPLITSITYGSCRTGPCVPPPPPRDDND